MSMQRICWSVSVLFVFSLLSLVKSSTDAFDMRRSNSDYLTRASLSCFGFNSGFCRSVWATFIMDSTPSNGFSTLVSLRCAVARRTALRMSSETLLIKVSTVLFKDLHSVFNSWQSSSVSSTNFLNLSFFANWRNLLSTLSSSCLFAFRDKF